MWLSLKQGDAQAGARLLQAFYADLYRYGVRLADDQGLVRYSIQEIFAQLWQKRARPPRCVRAWRICSNPCFATCSGPYNANENVTLFTRKMDLATDIAFSVEDFLIADEAQQAPQTQLAEALDPIDQTPAGSHFSPVIPRAVQCRNCRNDGPLSQSLDNLSHEAIRALKKLVLGMAHWVVAWPFGNWGKGLFFSQLAVITSLKICFFDLKMTLCLCLA